jgi:hypothetical protein
MVAEKSVCVPWYHMVTMNPKDYLRTARLRAECVWLVACVTTVLSRGVRWALWVAVPLLVLWLVISAFACYLGRP